MIVNEGLTLLLFRSGALRYAADIQLISPSLLRPFFHLLLSDGPSIDVLDHARQQPLQIVRLIQVAGVGGEMPQVFGLAQAHTQDLPRMWAQSVVNKLKSLQHHAARDLLSESRDDLGVNLRILRDNVLVIVWFVHGPISIISVGVRLAFGVWVLYVLPDTDSCMTAQLLEVFSELICRFLQLSARALV